MNFTLKNTSSFMLSLIAILCLSQPLLAKNAQSSNPNGQQQFSSVEERRIYTKMMEARKNANGEQKDLSIRKKELKTLNDAVDKKLKELGLKLQELQTMESNLKALLEKKDVLAAKKIKELGKIYEKMSPDKAALAISKIDNKLATELLANMKVKSAAKILDALDRKKATELSKTFSTVK